MTGEKNRFKTTEKLWNLDDKQLSSPEHDAMVLWLMEEKNAKKVLHPITNLVQQSTFIDSKKLDVCEFNIRSEIPFQARNGFINAYGDLEIHRHETVKEKYYECKISEKVLSLIEDAKTVGDIKSILKSQCMVTDYNPCLKEEYYLKTKDYYGTGEILPMDSWIYRNPSPYSDVEVLDLKLVDFFDNFTGFPKGMPLFALKEWITRNNWYKWTSNDIQCLIEVKPYIDSFGAVLRQINSYKAFWRPINYSDCQKYVCLFTLDNRFDAQFEQQGIIVLHPPADFNLDEVREFYGLV